MNADDVLWRILERLEESKRIFSESLEGLHPKHDKELIDTITEIEQLTQTQINLCRRAERRIGRR